MKLRYNTSAIRALNFHRDFWGWGAILLLNNDWLDILFFQQLSV